MKEKLEIIQNKEKKEKPEFLYHASPNKTIEVLEPRRKSYRDPKEGEVVFATQDLAFVTIYLMERHGSMLNGHFNDIPYAVIIGDREDFIKNDKGGNIYVVPSDTFNIDPNRGSQYEWTSKEKIKPIKVLEYKSSLEAALENGVQVYFVDENTYRDIEKAEDDGFSILSNMESENQKRGVNVKSLY